jgi:hypothetical protein
MNKKTTIYLLITLVLTSIFSIVCFMYVFRAIESKNEHTSLLLGEIAGKTVNKEDVESFTKRATQIKQVDSDIQSHFVDSKDIAHFVDFLENLGSGAHVDVSVKSVDSVSTDKNTLSVHLSTKGYYSNTIQFVNLLEHSAYYVHITGLSVTQDANTAVDATGKPIIHKGPSTWQGDITFTTLVSL